MTDGTLSCQHQQDWAYTREKGGSWCWESSQMNEVLLSIFSRPGLSAFPVVDWTLIQTARFLMAPDCPHGFGVLHIGRLWDDRESKSRVLVISLQL